MSFLAGDLLTAQRINRLQPKPYVIKASGTLAAGSTNADVPGASIAFTTETAGATVKAWWHIDVDLTGATTSLTSARAVLDGSTGADVFATYVAEVSTDRSTVGQVWDFTVAAAGAHTIKLVATTPANVQLQIYTALSIIVFEVV